MRSLLLALPVGALGLVAARAEPPKVERAPARPTYAKEVAPILNRACVSCHQPGEVAPFSLRGYEAAKKWSAMAAATTKTRQMPPWKAAAGYGEFKHENRLSDVEIQTLANWAAGGAPRGDVSREPAAPPLAKGGWTLGPPDLTLTPKGDYKLDAEGDDVYRNFVLENPTGKDLWIKGADVHPGNKAVVHHVIVVSDTAHAGRKLAAAAKDGQEGYTTQGGGVGFVPTGAIAGWVPGLRAERSPEGYAFHVPAGADLVVQVHYHKSGKPETDKTQVGLYLAEGPQEHEYKTYFVANFGLNVPANEKAFHAHQEFTVSKNVTLHGVVPHMHNVGQSMRAKAVLPDGREIPLIDVPHWDFNWQLVYQFKESIPVPAGTKIVVDATYDNSTANPRNPNNPPKRLHWGEQTTDEMMLLVVGYTVDAEGKKE